MLMLPGNPVINFDDIEPDTPLIYIHKPDSNNFCISATVKLKERSKLGITCEVVFVHNRGVRIRDEDLELIRPDQGELFWHVASDKDKATDEQKAIEIALKAANQGVYGPRYTDENATVNQVGTMYLVKLYPKNGNSHLAAKFAVNTTTKLARRIRK